MIHHPLALLVGQAHLKILSKNHYKVIQDTLEIKMKREEQLLLDHQQIIKLLRPKKMMDFHISNQIPTI